MAPARATVIIRSIMTALALIAAVAKNGVIGSGNALPWRLPADMKRFRELTTGHAVIMGRKTWESIGRPLAQRQNIVVTRQRDYAADSAIVVTGLDEALRAVTLPTPAFCIGGAELYAVALPRATTLHCTQIDREFDGDTRFPDFDRSLWRETAREEHSAPEGFNYAFVTYERR
jgi:dihydrofolate reductase